MMEGTALVGGSATYHLQVFETCSKDSSQCYRRLDGIPGRKAAPSSNSCDAQRYPCKHRQAL